VYVDEDSLLRTRPLTAVCLSAHELEQERGLLTPDDSLASHASLVSMAVDQPLPQNVIARVLPNTASVNETITTMLPPTTPEYADTMYRVKKTHLSSTDNVSQMMFGLYLDGLFDIWWMIWLTYLTFATCSLLILWNISHSTDQFVPRVLHCCYHHNC